MIRKMIGAIEEASERRKKRIGERCVDQDPVAEETTANADQVLEMFQAFDCNGDGFIDRHELAEVLQALHAEVWTDDKIDKLLAAADSDGDMRIDYSELLNWVFSYQPEAAILRRAGGEASKLDEMRLDELRKIPLLAVLQKAAAGNRCALIRSREEAPSRTSFSNKPVVLEGDSIDFEDLGITFQCRKGLKPESFNQNDFIVAHIEGMVSIYVVIDGHGKNGEQVSNLVQEHLLKFVLDDKKFWNVDWMALLRGAFSKTQQLLAAADQAKTLSVQLSGAQCLVIVHDLTRGKLTLASVGNIMACVGGTVSILEPDSGEIIGKQMDEFAKLLTPKHTPDTATEKERIERSGGRVVFDGYANYRVYAQYARYPGLSMSRSLGDILGHDCGITCVPSLSEHLLEDHDRLLFACCKGVTEFMNADEIMQFVNDNPNRATERLAKEAWDRWIKEEGGAVVEDLAVVCVRLPALTKVVVTLRATEAEGSQAVSCLSLGGDAIYSSSLEAKLTVQELRNVLASELKLEPNVLRMVLPSGRMLEWCDLDSSVSDLLASDVLVDS